MGLVSRALRCACVVAGEQFCQHIIMTSDLKGTFLCGSSNFINWEKEIEDVLE